LKDGVIDAFINRSENKNWWRTIKDELNQKNIVLTDEQLSVL
jgi:ribosome biogenesis protein ERB1